MGNDMRDQSIGGHPLRVLIDAAIEATAETLDLPVFFVDLRASQWVIPMDSLTRFSGYCRSMWQSQLEDRCALDHLSRAASVKGPQAGLCYAGRWNFAHPVTWNAQHVGTLLCGQAVAPLECREEARSRHMRQLRSASTAGSELRETLVREFDRGRRVRWQEVHEPLSKLASWIAKAYTTLEEIFPDDNLSPGEFDDPWSLMVHELQNANAAVVAHADELRAQIELNRIPESSKNSLLQLADELGHHLTLFDLLASNLFGDQALSYSDRESVCLSCVFEYAVRIFTSQARRNGITIDFGAERNVRILGSADYLNVMALNLVGNAVKYSYKSADKQKRWIGVSVTDEGPWAEVRVANYGVGIQPDEIPHIFRKYVRGESAKRERGTGSGLGLYAVKNAVNVHRGKVDVTSVPQSDDVNCGPHLVTFIVRLPKRQA